MRPKVFFKKITSILVLTAFALVILKSISFSQEEKKTNEVSSGEGTGWRIRDYKPYIKAIKELEKLNKEYSENLGS